MKPETTSLKKFVNKDEIVNLAKQSKIKGGRREGEYCYDGEG